jgi:hypothetical protein
VSLYIKTIMDKMSVLKIDDKKPSQN